MAITRPIHTGHFNRCPACSSTPERRRKASATRHYAAILDAIRDPEEKEAMRVTLSMHGIASTLRREA